MFLTSFLNRQVTTPSRIKDFWLGRAEKSQTIPADLLVRRVLKCVPTD